MSIKQVIVVRRKYFHADGTPFSLRAGKMIAQGAHASMAFLTRRLQKNRNLNFQDFTTTEQAWIEGTFTKVTCQVDSEEALQSLHEQAVAAGLESHLIIDSGKTEFNGVPTATALAIGPDTAERIDPITRTLSLY